MIEAIDEAFYIGLPLDDNDKLQELSQRFHEQSNGIFDGLVMVMDGMAVRTRAPFENEVSKRKDYRFRKGGFAIIALAGCDADARFISATANHSGSTNDIIAWNNSNLCKAVEYDRRLPAKYFFIGVEAFTNSSQFLSPWPGRGLDQYKDSFNYWLSHSRQIVERAFRMLTQCWGIFWRIFTFSFHRWSLVTMVCMKLHNLCIDRNVSVPLQHFVEDHRPGDEWLVLDNTQDNDILIN
jgi:hypothetical protein